MSTHVTTIIWALQRRLPYEENTMIIREMILWSKVKFIVFWVFFVIIFPSGGYVSSVAQHQKKSYVWWWNRDYGEKDITALKAILLLSLFKCLHVLHPTGKVYSQRRLDMGGGGHVCWQFWTDTVVVILAHDSLLLYNPWTEEVKEEWRN